MTVVLRPVWGWASCLAAHTPHLCCSRCGWLRPCPACACLLSAPAIRGLRVRGTYALCDRLHAFAGITGCAAAAAVLVAGRSCGSWERRHSCTGWLVWVPSLVYSVCLRARSKHMNMSVGGCVRVCVGLIGASELCDRHIRGCSATWLHMAYACVPARGTLHERATPGKPAQPVWRCGAPVSVPTVSHCRQVACALQAFLVNPPPVSLE